MTTSETEPRTTVPGIHGRTKQCFRQYVESHGKIDAAWNVLQGGKLDIDIEIGAEQGHSPDKPSDYNAIFSQYYVQDTGQANTWSFPTILPGSNLVICWNNEKSRFTKKKIQFELRIDHRIPLDMHTGTGLPLSKAGGGTVPLRHPPIFPENLVVAPELEQTSSYQN